MVVKTDPLGSRDLRDYLGILESYFQYGKFVMSPAMGSGYALRDRGSAAATMNSSTSICLHIGDSVCSRAVQHAEVQFEGESNLECVDEIWR